MTHQFTAPTHECLECEWKGERPVLVEEVTDDSNGVASFYAEVCPDCGSPVREIVACYLCDEPGANESTTFGPVHSKCMDKQIDEWCSQEQTSGTDVSERLAMVAAQRKEIGR